MALRLKRRAGRDLQAATDWYNLRAAGLGRRFVVELDEVLQEVLRSPLAYQVIEGDVRRALLRRFPFSVYYFVEGEDVVVIAILHFRQHPDGWKGSA